MTGAQPKRPGGSNSGAVFLQWVWDSLVYGRILESPTVKPDRTARGIQLHARPGRGGAASVQRMRVKEVHYNYLVCHTWDGTTEGTEDIIVAKPPYLRHNYTSIYIDGKWYNLAFDVKPNNEDGVRFVTPQDGSGPAITEEVIPVYFIQDSPVSEIWADEPSGGVGTINDDDDVALDPQPTYMDTNRDARRWCEVQSQTQNQGLSTAGYQPTSGGAPTTDQ